MNQRELILNLLNDEQREALLYFDGPLRIIAGAGSGKTRVLTRKVAYLINELGIPAKEILALTFTNKAANEMAERIRHYTSEKDSPNVCTIHSLCSQILRKEAFHLNLSSDFQIIDEVDKKNILKDLFRERAADFDDQDIPFANIIQKFSWAKNAGYTKDEMLDELNNESSSEAKVNQLIGLIYEDYNKYLIDKKCLDYDDLIIRTNELFKKCPEVVKYWSLKYSYILVDEFQDTSVSQYEIIKGLASTKAQLTIVGDPDQTIYGWRGADVNLILDFDKDFVNTKTVILNTNYRSTKTILDAANKLIKYNTKRFSKDLVTNNPVGDPIEFTHAFSVDAEARWVVQKINELKKQKIQLKNIAIFYRSNYYSRPFEEALLKEQINHKIFNGLKFFQRREVKDALAFLRVIYDGSDLALRRIINVPSRQIGEQTLTKLERFVAGKKTSLYQGIITYLKDLPIRLEAKKNLVRFLNAVHKYRSALKNNKISQVLERFLSDIEYYEYIEGDLALRETGRDNVNELIRSITAWEHENPNLTVKEYLEKVSLLSAGDEYDNLNNYVSLMTVHSAKGLEFDNVFLVGMSEMIFPHYKSLESGSKKSKIKNGALEEERRLAYVAITRAKNKLFISDSRGALVGTNIQKSPSRFIKEMGINLKKFIIQQSNISLDYDVNDEKQVKAINRKILVGDIISHATFGEGTVLDVEDDTITVRFVNNPNNPKILNKNHPSIRLLREGK